ncbi:MAG: hypothetical protein JWN36_2257 [Microbacteriaceae bacterium]|nr:hypothetical protein [Microbacteriaceae bacterium]
MTTQQRLRTARTRAIAMGGRSINPDEERIALPIDLVATAIGGLAELTAAALIGVDLVDRDLPAVAVHEAKVQARNGACRALRLCQRALEADARSTGYDWRPWVDATIHDSAYQLDQAPDQGGTLRHADGLARSLSEATRALAYDRMALPEALSIAQTHALMLVVAAED